MIGSIWNIRGLNKTDRVKCLSDLVKTHKCNFLGIQETKKASFVDRELNAIDSNMNWNYIPAVGTAGGILLGFRNKIFEVLNWDNSQYCATAMVTNWENNFIWRIVVFYGSPYEDTKLEFIRDFNLPLGGGGVISTLSEAKRRRIMGRSTFSMWSPLMT
jgi:hypothetical protein